jgi:lipopolysaccharide/colanic/teichoic acid biosynthesis glycosyltransferase
MTATTIKQKPELIDSNCIVDKIVTQFLLVQSVPTDNSSVYTATDGVSIVNSLQEAKVYLEQTTLSNLPELIILDGPVNLDELITFKSWLTKSLIPSIPVIYKEDASNNMEIKKLFRLNLIDDVIRNYQTVDCFREKAKFFKSLSVQSLIDKAPVTINKRSNKAALRYFAKRSIDIFLSVAALAVLTPLLLIVALLIKLTSKGPIIYKSKRAGQGFKVFDFYKFRTMVLEADEMVGSLHDKNMYQSSTGSPCFFKVSNDPRITKLGLLLRNTSIDELPQLLNVIKGDMSLVGNRPLPLYEAATLTTNEWAERFMAPAGITGLWQISKRGKSTMTAEERISLDISYARNRSTRKDLRILISTPLALIQRQSQ